MAKHLHRGKFIIFEGIDGAGTETQSKLLFNYLKKRKKGVEKLTYPDKNGVMGKLIYKYLHQEHNIAPEIQFLLHLADFAKDQLRIKTWLKRGKIVIADRYFTSTLAYQGTKGVALQKCLVAAKIFGVIKPDLVIFLKISPETSAKRKYQEKSYLDRHERDKKFLKQVADFYSQLIRQRVFVKWRVVDGEKPIEYVFADVKKILKL